ncbi:hypothetical protein D3C72_2436160 [compost metagenome]
MLRKLQTIEHDNPSEHLGVQNVKRRILLVYGTGFGLQLASQPDEGTTVRYILPIRKE